MGVYNGLGGVVWIFRGPEAQAFPKNQEPGLNKGHAQCSSSHRFKTRNGSDAGSFMLALFLFFPCCFFCFCWDSGLVFSSWGVEVLLCVAGWRCVKLLEGEVWRFFEWWWRGWRRLVGDLGEGEELWGRRWGKRSKNWWRLSLKRWIAVGELWFYEEGHLDCDEGWFLRWSDRRWLKNWVKWAPFEN